MAARDERAGIVSRVKGRRGPRSAVDRVEKLLVILPWLMKRESASIAEMAELFGIDKDELVGDLIMASMCGVPPYTPYDLAELIIDDETVSVGPLKKFNENLRLSPTEAFGLSVLADAARELPGMKRDKKLKAAVAKLRAELSADLVDIKIDRPPLLDAVGEAASEGRKLRITYYSPSTDEVTERVILPRLVFSDLGHWYVTADDELRRSERHFRIDRIRALEPLDEVVPMSSMTVSIPDWFADADDLPVARLRLQPAGRWVEESYPCTVVAENPDGTVEIELRYSSEHWLSRLLMRAGLAVTVLEPESARDLQRRASELVLGLYLD